MASTFYFENHVVFEIMWINNEERGRTHENMAQTRCMLDN